MILDAESGIDLSILRIVTSDRAYESCVISESRPVQFEDQD